MVSEHGVEDHDHATLVQRERDPDHRGEAAQGGPQEGGEGRQSQPGLTTLRRRVLALGIALVAGACSSGNRTVDRSIPTSLTTTTTDRSTTTSTTSTSTTLAAAGTTTGPGSTATTPTTVVTTTPAPVATEITVRGTVAGVFASARVIQLIPPMNGIASVALSADTELVRAGGGRAALNDVMPGATIEAIGLTSAPGTLVARRITVL